MWDYAIYIYLRIQNKRCTNVLYELIEGTVAGKHSYLLYVASHKGKWETVIFTIILLQLWGVISGLFQCVCSIKHTCFKLFPIYDNSLFPLISGLTFFSLKYLYHLETPNSYLHVCPARVQALLPLPQVAMDTRTWLGIAFAKGGPAPRCSIPVILKSHTRWFSRLRTETEVWLELRAERTFTQLQIRENCSVKRRFSCMLRTSQWEVIARDKGMLHFSREERLFLLLILDHITVVVLFSILTSNKVM